MRFWSHRGRTSRPAATMTAAPVTLHRTADTGRGGACASAAAIARLRATAIFSEPWTPTVGTSTKPASIAPTIAPAVLTAYRTPTCSPARPAARAHTATAHGKL